VDFSVDHPSHPPFQSRDRNVLWLSLSRLDSPSFHLSHWIIASLDQNNVLVTMVGFESLKHHTKEEWDGNGILGYPKAIFKTRNSRMVDDDLFSAAESGVGFHKKQ
jgi:hypothetical protein